MKKFKKMSALFLSVLLLLSCMTITAYAAQSAAQDGLSAVIETDKETYEANEPILVTVTVTNTNSFAIKNVSIESILPAELTVQDGTLKSDTVDLEAGQELTLTFTAVLEEETVGDITTNEPTTNVTEITTENDDHVNGTSPFTGASGLVLKVLLVIFMVAAVAFAIVMLTKKNGKKATKIISVVLAGTLSASMLATSAIARAETVQESFTIDKTIVIGETTYTLKSTVFYSTYDENVLYTISFDSNGGGVIEKQVVPYGGFAEEPVPPERENYVFSGWYDSDGNYFDFSEPVMKDVQLVASWIQITEKYDDGFDLNDSEGKVSIPIQCLDHSPITNVDVSYVLNGEGDVEIREVVSDPMLLTAGLVGIPVEINAFGGEVETATITFHYDTEKLLTEPDDLAVVWFDEENNIVRLLDDSTVDVDNQTISVTTSHFSKYGVVSKNAWNEAWNKELPPMRTESTPYYNVVLAMDRSGSMSGQKMSQSIQAAQNFIDVLADNDCISVIAFADSVRTIIEQSKLNENIRQSIKDQISSITASGGTSIENALQSAMNYVSSDSQYQSLIVLVSDGQSSVSDQTLNELKDLGQKVVTVGIGSDVNDSLMRKIAEMTGGNYLYCDDAEDIADAFIELQNAYIGSTKDTDGDGLPDLVEISGMRDQYGEIWHTDPDDPDTDKDGFSDGDEMGEFNASALRTYFSRISRPDMYTIKSDEAYLMMPETMSYSVTDDNKLEMTIYIVDAHYRMVPDLLTPMDSDGIPKEYIYSEPKNLKVNVVETPSEFHLEKIDVVKEENQSAAATYKATATFSFDQTAEWKTVIWHVTADNCSEWSGYSQNGIMANYIEREQSVLPSAAIEADKKKNEKAVLAKMQLAGTVKRFIDRFAYESNEKNNLLLQENKAAVTQLKNMYTSTQGAVPDAVFTAIGQAIMETTNASIISKYEIDQIHNQVASQILNGLRDIDEEVVVNGITYEIKGSIWASSGVYVSFINVTYSGKTIRLATASTQEEIANALANYCSVLAQLSNDVWKDFISCYVTDAFGLSGIKSITKNNVDLVLDKGEVVIKALCNKKYADELIQVFGDAAREELSGVFTNKFDDFIEATIPNGKEFIEAAKKFKAVYDSLEKYLNALDQYTELVKANASQNEQNKAKNKKDEADTEFNTAYQTFNTLVNAL